jgi:hypothetical protein
VDFQAARVAEGDDEVALTPDAPSGLGGGEEFLAPDAGRDEEVEGELGRFSKDAKQRGRSFSDAPFPQKGGVAPPQIVVVGELAHQRPVKRDSVDAEDFSGLNDAGELVGAAFGLSFRRRCCQHLSELLRIFRNGAREKSDFFRICPQDRGISGCASRSLGRFA